jgi:beta-N-acetylhexosaminidase
MLGPVFTGITGFELTAEEKKLLQHPAVGGVILFSRNIASPEQVQALTKEIHALCSPALIIAVDQEGGRVARLRDGFTTLPALASIGALYQKNPAQGLEAAKWHGWMMATEVLAVGIDLSLAPVLDLDYAVSKVISTRSLGREPEAVIALARAYIAGMKQAGMVATGKHFPGHGAIAADSHTDLPIDARTFAQISHDDLQPFAALSSDLAAIMPAHVVYTQVDSLPAGFSEKWLQEVLRAQLQFTGLIMTDDLGMAGANIPQAPTFAKRAALALRAGADVLLLCNELDERQGLLQAVTEIGFKPRDFAELRGQPKLTWAARMQNNQWLEAQDYLQGIA